MIEVYDLRRLPEEGATVDEPLEKEWLETALNDDLPQEELSITARGEGRAKLELHAVASEAGDPVVRVRGTISAPLAAACVRCLSEVEIDVKTTADLTLFPAKAAAAKNGEIKSKARIELSKDQLEEGTYADQKIDLPSIVREALLLEAATDPRCPDEAACEARTQALIASVGAVAKDDPVDPRWAALQQLKSKLS